MLRNGAYTHDGWLKVTKDQMAVLDSLAPFRGEAAIDKFPAGSADSVKLEERVPGKTVKRLESMLPDNWDMSVRGNYVLLTYEKQVQGETHAPSGPGAPSEAEAWNEIWQRRVQICLRVEPQFSTEDWKERHQALSQELIDMESDMRAFKDPPRVKPGLYGYSPKTEKQRAMLSKYGALRERITSLPDFFDGDCAVEISSSLGPWDHLLDADATKSFEAMKKAVEGQFKRYDESP